MTEPTDDRDPRLAERLAVDPLDEMTRTRLVRGALAASPHRDAPAAPRRFRHPARVVLAVAAVLVAMLAVGIGLLVRDNGSSRPTALVTPKAANRGAAEERSLSAGPESSATAGDATPVAVPDLGDLGDVTRTADLRRAVAAIAPRGTTNPPACALTKAGRAGQLAAAGTGRVAGDAVLVLVVQRPGGGRDAIVVSVASCAVLRTTTLR